MRKSKSRSHSSNSHSSRQRNSFHITPSSHSFSHHLCLLLSGREIGDCTGFVETKKSNGGRHPVQRWKQKEQSENGENTDQQKRPMPLFRCQHILKYKYIRSPLLLLSQSHGSSLAFFKTELPKGFTRRTASNFNSSTQRPFFLTPFRAVLGFLVRALPLVLDFMFES